MSDADITGTRGCVQDLAEGSPSRNFVLMRLGARVDKLGGAGRALGRALDALGTGALNDLLDAMELALPKFGAVAFAGIPKEKALRNSSSDAMPAPSWTVRTQPKLPSGTKATRSSSSRRS